MSIIGKIRLQVRIQASRMLHDSENIPFDVWCDARVIPNYVEHLLVMRGIIQDQIDEDLEDVRN
jgi:hypothetical protein